MRRRQRPGLDRCGSTVAAAGRRRRVSPMIILRRRERGTAPPACGCRRSMKPGDVRGGRCPRVTPLDPEMIQISNAVGRGERRGLVQGAIAQRKQPSDSRSSVRQYGYSPPAGRRGSPGASARCGSAGCSFWALGALAERRISRSRTPVRGRCAPAAAASAERSTRSGVALVTGPAARAVAGRATRPLRPGQDPVIRRGIRARA